MARRDEEKWQYWTGHTKRWETSGLAQRAYCQREGLKFATFDYWRRQIHASAKAKPAKKQSTGNLTLVPIRVTDQQNNSAIVLRSPAGWQLRLSSMVEPAWLINILRSLP
jgi:hypothetical protein